MEISDRFYLSVDCFIIFVIAVYIIILLILIAYFVNELITLIKQKLKAKEIEKYRSLVEDS